MRAPYHLILMAFLALFLLSGCSTWYSTVKGTKKLYTDYVVPEADVDLDVEYLEDNEELKLARLFTPVDERIHQLRIMLTEIYKRPTEEWYRKLFTRFPWLSGVMVVDLEGYKEFQFPPEAALKEMNIQPLVDFGDQWMDHKSRGHSEITDLGSEVYIGTPIFEDEERKGLIIVHFDPRKLLPFCPIPEELIILSPAGVMWGGKHQAYANTLMREDWKDILRDDVYGELTMGGVDYLWVARDLGYYSLIYATSTGGAFNSSELDAIEEPEEVVEEESVEVIEEDSEEVIETQSQEEIEALEEVEPESQVEVEVGVEEDLSQPPAEEVEVEEVQIEEIESTN